jgi:hypothetical protein
MGTRSAKADEQERAVRQASEVTSLSNDGFVEYLTVGFGLGLFDVCPERDDARMSRWRVRADVE